MSPSVKPKRISSTLLRRVGVDHIYKAIQGLLEDDILPGFRPSTDYDLLAEDGRRLSPKIVFGIVASDALGFEVTGQNFTGGLDTVCFDILERAGYRIVPKSGQAKPWLAPFVSEEWAEGSPKLIKHVKRERARGLARAKKDQFLRIHGQLFCEQCGVVPTLTYGSEHGDAVIEIHHERVQIRDMEHDHRTKLDDVKCLCANCHRLIHSEMSKQEAAKLKNS